MQRQTLFTENTQIDFGLVLIYFLLSIFGWLALYSVSAGKEYSSIFANPAFRQLIWILISLVLATFILNLKPYRIYSYIYPFYLFVLMLSLFTAFFGAEIKGNRSWLVFGGFSFQPSELLKFATALIFAKIIAKYKDELTSLGIIVFSFLPVVLAFGTVVLQGDMGTALVFGAFIIPAYREKLFPGYLVLMILIYGVFFFLTLKYAGNLWLFVAGFIIGVLLLLANFWSFRKQILKIYGITLILLHFFKLVIGLKFSHKFTLIFAFLLASIIFLILNFKTFREIGKFLVISGLIIGLFITTYASPIFYDKLKPHQKSRIEFFIHPEKLLESTTYEHDQVGYNIRQAKLSISAGGFLGRGYLKGTHNRLGFVPAQRTDYIFCTVAEELGFVGSAIAIILYFILFLKIIIIAERQTSNFTRIYAYSVLGILFFHFAINLGSTLSLLPVIGIPLPFFSYGGSAFMSYTLMLATLLAFDTERHIKIEDIY